MQRDFPVPVQRQKGIRVSGGKGPGCTALRVLHSPDDTGIQPTDIMPGQLRLLRLPVVPSMWQKTIVTLHHKDSSDWQNHFYVCRKSNKSNMRKKRKYEKYVSLCHFIHCEEMFRNSQEGWYGSHTCSEGQECLGQGPQAMGWFWFSTRVCLWHSRLKSPKEKGPGSHEKEPELWSWEPLVVQCFLGTQRHTRLKQKSQRSAPRSHCLRKGGCTLLCQAAATTAASPAGTGSHRLEVHTQHSCALWGFCVLSYMALKRCLGSVIQATPH